MGSFRFRGFADSKTGVLVRRWTISKEPTYNVSVQIDGCKRSLRFICLKMRVRPILHVYTHVSIYVCMACEQVASDLGLGGGFRRVLWFPPLLTTG